jgi:hypothetical protein
MPVADRVKRLRAELARLESQRGPDCWFEGRHWISRNKCIAHVRSMLPPEAVKAPEAAPEAVKDEPEE